MNCNTKKHALSNMVFVYFRCGKVLHFTFERWYHQWGKHNVIAVTTGKSFVNEFLQLHHFSTFVGPVFGVEIPQDQKPKTQM